ERRHLEQSGFAGKNTSLLLRPDVQHRNGCSRYRRTRFIRNSAENAGTPLREQIDPSESKKNENPEHIPSKRRTRSPGCPPREGIRITLSVVPWACLLPSLFFFAEFLLPVRVVLFLFLGRQRPAVEFTRFVLARQKLFLRPLIVNMCQFG